MPTNYPTGPETRDELALMLQELAAHMPTMTTGQLSTALQRMRYIGRRLLQYHAAEIVPTMGPAL